MRIVEFSGGVSRACAAMALAAAGLVAAASPAAAAPPDVVLRWQDTVQIEHADRRRRLQRLSGLSLVAPPEFHESLIGRAELPALFGVDIPVLRVVFPQRVFFDTAADRMRPEAERVLDVVAAALSREAGDTAVFVAGHTDSRGDDGYNYDLSVRRARSVAEALKDRGVPQVHIWRVGFGEAVPREPNTTDANMARNRRVEFLFARKPEAVATLLSKQRAEICRGSAPAVRAQCPIDLAGLPRVEAVPVLADRPTTGSVTLAPPGKAAVGPPTIDVTGLTPVTPSRAEVARRPEETVQVDRPGAGTVAVATAVPGTVAVPPPGDVKGVAIIRPTDRVVLDMKDERVFVDRPRR